VKRGEGEAVKYDRWRDGAADLYDADGYLLPPHVLRADTETGLAVQPLLNEAGNVRVDGGGVVTETVRYKAPLDVLWNTPKQPVYAKPLPPDAWPPEGLKIRLDVTSMSDTAPVFRTFRVGSPAPESRVNLESSEPETQPDEKPVKFREFF
jgi:hypothetical protein